MVKYYKNLKRSGVVLTTPETKSGITVQKYSVTLII